MSTCSMTHDEIGEFIAERLRKEGWPLVWANMRAVAAGEQPDVLAYRSLSNHKLFEVKVSRSDFLADKKKRWRQEPENGIGTERIYVTPQGLLKPEEIPYGWQLWEIVEQKNRTIVKVVKGVVKRKCKVSPSGYKHEYPNLETPRERLFFNDKSNIDAMINWLQIIFKRAQLIHGDTINKLGNNEYLKELGIYSE